LKACHLIWITPNFICINYKQFMATFDNIFQVESNGMKVASICTQHVKQLFALYISWITLPNDILVDYSKNIMHPNFHLIWHLQVCTFNMFQTSKLLSVISPYVKWNLWFWIHHEQKALLKFFDFQLRILVKTRFGGCRGAMLGQKDPLYWNIVFPKWHKNH